MSAAFDTFRIPTNSIRRVSYADFMDDFGAWMVKRFTSQFPNMAPESVTGILRSLAESNEFYLVRTEGAVMLAKLVKRLFKEPHYVEVEFVFCRPDPIDGLRRAEAEPEGLELLADATRWARSMGCNEVRFSKTLDFPIMALKKLPEPPSQLTIHRVEISK